MTLSRRSVIASGLAAPFILRSGWSLAADPIKIGLFTPLSGPVAATGESHREAVTLVVNEKNQAGGIRGQQIELVIADDAAKPEEGVSIARRFSTRDNVLVALGSATSPVSLAASQVFGEAQVPQIVITSTAQRITTQGNQWVFRSAAPDTKFVTDMANFVGEKLPNVKRFAILNVNDDFGKGGTETFKEAGKKFGWTIATEERYASGDLDFTGQLSRIRDAKPDAILDWGRYTEGALIARQMANAGMLSIPRFGSDSYANPKYIELAGAAANGMIYPSPFSPAVNVDTPVAKQFVEKFRSARGKLPNYDHVQAHDAITIAITAIERAAKADRTAVPDAIRQTDFESGRGHFKFDEKGDPTFPTTLIRVVDGKETNARSAG